MHSFVYENWVYIVAVLLAVDVIAWLIKNTDPFPPSVLDTKEGREAFVEAMVAPLRTRQRP